MIPGLDLSWLTDCANGINDARGEVDHLRRLADQDALEELRDALGVARKAMLDAERIAANLARKHGVSRGLVGDTERDGVEA
jgi:hypothetical protein